MPDRSLSRASPTILAAAMLVAACSALGPGATAVTTPSLTAVASRAPDVTGPPLTPGPTAAAPSTAEPPAAEPPAATLAVEGGDPVAGQLGSFTRDGGGSDSPWLPGSPIAVGAGERMAVTLATAPGIAGWGARRAPAGAVDGIGAVALGQGAGPVTFGAPPPGTWSVQLTVQFAGDRGSATYYWKVTVP